MKKRGKKLLVLLLLGEHEDDLAILVALELGATSTTLEELESLAKSQKHKIK